MRAARGVSLHELLLTLGLFAGMLLLAGPSFREAVERFRLRDEAQRFGLALHLARAEAIKRTARVVVLPVGADWRGGWLVFEDPDRDHRQGSGERLIQRFPPLAPGTRILQDTLPGYVGYEPSGQSQRDNGAFLAGTLTLCREGAAMSVVVNSGGRPRLASSAC